MINQLFNKQPPNEIILECLCALGFDSFEDTNMISTATMISTRTIDMFKVLIPQLMEFYTRSKHKKYLVYSTTSISTSTDNANTCDLTIKKCITITKQLMKTIGYDLISKEKMVEGNKVLYYRITTSDDKKNMKKKEIIQPVIIRFD